jgi:sulfur-oxidizing protein SoxX
LVIKIHFMNRCKAIVLATLVASGVGSMTVAAVSDSRTIEAGRAIAQDVYKGNCLACHQIPGDASAVSMANIGPPLTHMQQRFPDREALREQIWDSTRRNPSTVMPPFGKHRILTEQEIDLVVDYLYQY